MSACKDLIGRLKAMQGRRGDRSPERWLGDGVHPPVTVSELLAALTEMQYEYREAGAINGTPLYMRVPK
jgi:hypothetical protein